LYEKYGNRVFKHHRNSSFTCHTECNITQISQQERDRYVASLAGHTNFYAKKLKMFIDIFLQLSSVIAGHT